MDFRVPKSKLTDRSLISDIYGLMIARLGAHAENEREILVQATPGQRLLYILLSVEGEINNGGFDQLFRNSAGEFMDDAIRYADQLGAMREAELLQQAAAIFPSGVPQDRDTRQDQLDALPAELGRDRLKRLDSAWFRDLLAFEPHLRTYIDAHPEEFFRDA